MKGKTRWKKKDSSPKQTKSSTWRPQSSTSPNSSRATRFPASISLHLLIAKKNIEALTKANIIAFEGWQALVRRQTEILQETMKETIANACKQDTVKHRVDLARQGFEKSLDHMRELAEMAARSQKEAFEVVRKRVDENVEHFKSLGKGK